MKFMNKQLLAAVALLSIGSIVNASYELDFGNLIRENMHIVIKINQRRADNKDYYQIIPNGGTVKQVFNNAYCLEKVWWAPFNPNAPLRGGLDLLDKETLRVPEENQEKFGRLLQPHYAFMPMEIKMLPNKVFTETVAAATNLLKGTDTMACAIIDQVKSFEGIKGAENLGKGAADLTKTIIEDGKSIVTDATKRQTKNKFDDLFSSTSSSNDPFAMFGSGSTSTTKPASKGTGDCGFGLGQIGEAAGKLAGIDLCKSRQFLIASKVTKDGVAVMDRRTGRPTIQALTREGE